MDYDVIIKNNDKYRYYAISSTKTIFLSSSNSKLEAQNLALEKLKPNIQNLIGKTILLVKLKSVVNAYEKQKIKKNSLNMIGGPLKFELEDGLIKSATKIKNVVASGGTNIYLSDKYIKKNKDNLFIDIKKVISNYFKNMNNVSAIDIIVL
jgi:hypothetical protein